MRLNIWKIYISHILMGVVFWYGIEKLFMQSIGIDAVGIGVVIAGGYLFNLLFDIPSGVIADRWSRKGMIIVGSISMVVCSLLLGSADDFRSYFVPFVIFGGIYVAAISGTYQAIVYDVLYEQKKAENYSKIMGRAYGLFLLGIGVANLASGFIANNLGYQMPFFLTCIPALANVLVVMSIKEPTFHKLEQAKNPLSQLYNASNVLIRIRLLQVLAIMLTVLTVVQLFKDSFGQLYILRYLESPEILGVLWAIAAFAWALGSLIAHHFRARLNWLVIASVIPLVIMSFVDSWISLVLFMVQHVAMSAMFNQIETRIQEATPSGVRASTLSVVSSAGRLISIPASFFIGWVILTYNVFWALRFVTILTVFVLIYWFWAKHHYKFKDVAVVAE